LTTEKLVTPLATFAAGFEMKEVPTLPVPPLLVAAFTTLGVTPVNEMSEGAAMGPQKLDWYVVDATA